ncbi:hypothetical protein B0H65DRAFT_451493 [Neurospora tetraspora]|uniref:Uncharacterized protein n=1 Tax=Neurospora tetraspora TaxID=94610 RepID=A0AAE0MWU2_9PEZI|nr:hypothetical protein B0H65DRAFT_451493 [Neurospora tetraspora]
MPSRMGHWYRLQFIIAFSSLPVAVAVLFAVGRLRRWLLAVRLPSFFFSSTISSSPRCRCWLLCFLQFGPEAPSQRYQSKRAVGRIDRGFVISHAMQLLFSNSFGIPICDGEESPLIITTQDQEKYVLSNFM